MEVSGRNTPLHSWYTGNVHAGTECSKDLGGSVTRQFNYGELADWHIWGLEWRPEVPELRFTTDGQLRPNGVFNTSAVLDLLPESYIILGLAVLDENGAAPSNATIFHQSVEFDWVRVSQWSSPQ